MISNVKRRDRMEVPFKIVIHVASVMIFVKVMFWLTKYAPFSFFWTDRPFHFRNRYIKTGTEIIKSEALRNKLDIEYLFSEVGEPFFIYHFYVFNKRKNLGKMLERIKSPLAVNFKTDPYFIYLRRTEVLEIWQFLIPLEDVYENEADLT